MDTTVDRLQLLASHGHKDGGWGYFPDRAPHLEPTCFALLALSADRSRYDQELNSGLRFLERCATPDGTYRVAEGREEAIWPTSLVLFTLAALGAKAEETHRPASRLLGLRGRVPDNPEAGELHDIDLKLVGWPWATHNFSWVEPTAWACLALAHVGQRNHPRVREGIALLLDRARDEGGINYGNRRILGRMTEPIPTTTALMLLALQGQRHPRITTACRYLIDQIAAGDLEHLCWIKLALDVHGDQPGVPEALPRLDQEIFRAEEERAGLPWLRPGIMRQALAALALATEKRNVFRFNPRLAADELAPAREKSGPGWTQRLGAWFRGLAVKAAGNLRPLPARSAVHIARADRYDADLAAILSEQYQHFRDHVRLEGKRVVLKPNLVEYHKDKVINTNPRVVGAVIELCKREGAREIIVAEGPGHWRNVEFLVHESGLGDVLKEHGVTFVDLNHDEPVKLPNLGRLTGLEYLWLAKTIATADTVISLPKLKTHHWAGATLSLKNLFGTLPGICYGWPKNELHWRGIENSIVDIALTRTPDLAIVDGIIGMEGDGPLNGTAKPLGALIMGNDLVAVDATCCRLMQLDADRVGYLVLAHAKKIGRLHSPEIQQLGEPIERLAQPFEIVPHLQQLRRRQSA
jgi:uncharacterized protein (DUF362 family)